MTINSKAIPNQSGPTLPCLNEQPLRTHFSESGFWLDRGPRHYTIINTHKGGVVYHFSQGRPALIDVGVVTCKAGDKYGSTQAYNPNNTVKLQGDELGISSQITAMPKQ